MQWARVLNASSGPGETLLHFFVQRGKSRLSAVKMLLSKSRELEEQGHPGAARKVLMTKDMKGFCAFSLAADKEIAETLMNHAQDSKVRPLPTRSAARMVARHATV
eukprot:3781521-Rhodomonas_salina.10